MKNSENWVLLVKERSIFLHFLSDLYEDLHRHAEDHGQTLDWFKYADRQNETYFFLPDKEKQFEVLGKVMDHMSARSPSFMSSQIADIMSNVINNTIENYLNVYGVTGDHSSHHDETDYLHSQVITVSSEPHHIPRFPWLMPLQGDEEDIWSVKNLANHTILTMKCEEQNGFISYFVMQTPEQMNYPA